MADPDYSAFLAPDSQLAGFWQQLQNNQITENQYNSLRDKRVSEISAAAGGVSVGTGSLGNVMPNYAYSEESGPQYAALLAAQEKMRAALANKESLTASATPGVYQKQYYDASGNVASGNDPRNSGSTKSFYDASGKQLSASQVANTDAGKGFAAAGWDIGFGPGMVAPGVKADTTARDAAKAAKLEARESKIVQSSSSVQTQPEQPAVDPIPLTSSLLPASNKLPPPPVKTAPIDTVLFNDDSMSIEIMADLIFEDIGGHELINIARNDIINGQQISYTPIKNLGLIQQRYNPNNILGLQATSEKYFANFPIKFEEKVPVEGNGPNGSNVYFDDVTGDLIIEGVNLNKDELFEVEVSLNGTIYEADFGATTS